MLAALTVFFPIRRHYAALIAFVVAGALAPVSLSLYLVWHHALTAGFNDVILFPAAHYAPIQGLPFGHWANERNVSMSTAIDGAFFVLFDGTSRFRFPPAVEGMGSGSGK